jgi:hypothetical protein
MALESQREDTAKTPLLLRDVIALAQFSVNGTDLKLKAACA